MSQKFQTNKSYLSSLIGATIGLGNIWKFPYTMAENGGFYFLILFILFIFIIAMPSFYSESFIGFFTKHSPKNAIDTIVKEKQLSKIWKSTTVVSFAIVFLAFAFYSIVTSWTLYFSIKIIITDNPQNISLNNILSDPFSGIYWFLLCVILCISVACLGAQNGIAKICNICIPMLFILILLLIGISYHSGAYDNFAGFSDYNFINFNTISSALGQALFSMATGAGCIVVYSSYADRTVNVFSCIPYVAICNVIVSIISFILIYPVIKNGFESNFAMIFKLGLIIKNKYWVLMFFILLFIASFTSLISQFESMVAITKEYFNTKQKIYPIIIIASLCIPFSISIIFSNAQMFYGINNLFQITISMIFDILMPVGAFSFAYLGSKIIMDYADFFQTQTSLKMLLILIKIILIPCIIFIFFYNFL